MLYKLECRFMCINPIGDIETFIGPQMRDLIVGFTDIRWFHSKILCSFCYA
ncbi:protein of unknown function [Vibrio tapetis subsp. tapetis]|uniref:Uncharacterized protein n=1 Tax=Vibrio tapetis subsp. tapetis TaxID=1671868 RepID=A0A2N8ZAJ5_9VIBR|nr:protein of unknown function [Vibrio tapetis subsp. tapetis]